VAKKKAYSLRSTLGKKSNGNDFRFMLTIILWTVDDVTGLNSKKVGEVADLVVVLEGGIDSPKGSPTVAMKFEIVLLMDINFFKKY